MKLTVKHTTFSCYICFFIQAIVNCFSPLVYAHFNTSLNIGFGKLAILGLFNFVVQIIVDLASALFVDRIGYRKSAIISHIAVILGLILLSFLPYVFSDSFVGVTISTVMLAIGGGLIEVVISPSLENLPLNDKEKQMSILHSFYCWGSCIVILVSTLLFKAFGIDKWFVLPLIWALIPLINIFFLARVPHLDSEPSKEESTFDFLKRPAFYILFIMMVAAGASEIAMSTWTSIFAELGLGVTKVVGDIFGPCTFAICMGIGRIVTAKMEKHVPISHILVLFAFLDTVCFFLAVLLVSPVFSLLACAFSGFFVSLFWPGTYSLGSSIIKNGKTKMFALFALGGDIGCSFGSYVVGIISDYVIKNNNEVYTFLYSSGRNIRAGLLIASIFPLIMFVGSTILLIYWKKRKG